MQQLTADPLLLKLVKEMHAKAPLSSEVQSSIALAIGAGYTITAPVVLAFDDAYEVGEVIGYNTRCHGFYDGERYPVIVEFARGTFEYGIDQLDLIPQM